MADPKPKKTPHVDAELEQYRQLLDTPTEFKDGFGWSTFIGILFCAVIMMPGSIYLGLMTGGDMDASATWVTLLLFSEVARRALKPLSKQNMVTLLHACGVIMAGNAVAPGGPMAGLIQRAYITTSDAVRDAGMKGHFPEWFVPSPESSAILERNLLHTDWLIPMVLIAFMMVIGLVKKYTLGYFLFRVTSDVEKLPFPMAPISAQGVLAMVQEEGDTKSAQEAKESDPAKKDDKSTPSRWRLFSLGTIFGMTFGFLSVGIPAVTGLFLEQPVFLIPQPFIDTTVVTQSVLPATPTGVALDLGAIFVGFVLPFWAVIGTFAAIVATIILNPILYNMGILTKWQPGMDTVNTTFANNLDFWMSFGIGAAVGIFVVSIYSLTRDLIVKTRELKAAGREHAAEDVWAPPRKGRGDYPLWLALTGYIVAAGSMVALIYVLVPALPVYFMMIFAFIYTPVLSYINARLKGISGQQVELPLVKEGFFLLSGAKGIDIWLAPIPIENHGTTAQSFRVNELTGVNFFSLIKADLVAYPVLFIASLMFWAFMWKANAVPSDVFPVAQIKWELASKGAALMYSSTFVPPGEEGAARSLMDSEFMKAMHPKVIASGFAVTVVMFAGLSYFGLPIMFVYGIVRGIGDLPHGMILEVIGAMIGRYVFQKKYGADNFLRMATTVLPGYATGVGLMGMATIALKLIQQAILGAPF